MKNFIRYFLLLAVVIVGMIQCSSDVDRGIPTLKDDAPPSPVTGVQVEAIPGGAILSYTLPESDNLLYVMAEYTIGDKLFEKKASFYSNNLIVQGFPDTKQYNLKLYSVSRSGTKSTPVSVKINPLTPPVVVTFDSAVLEPTFGGVKVKFENESESELKLVVLTTDSIGDLYPADIYYTKRKEGTFFVRGFAPEMRKFGFYALDRWNNYSDTLFVELTPWFEEKLDKFKFKPLNLPTDTYEAHANASFTLDKLWDDVWGISSTGIFHTKPNTGIPQWFTFDMGQTARLSRFKVFHRLGSNNGATADGQYSGGAPQIIEVYGSNNPASDGSWDSWTLLGQFESVKPSGDAKWTSEDIQYACFDGEDFEFENPGIYRYLRFKILKNWGGVSYIYLAELTFWGEVMPETTG